MSDPKKPVNLSKAILIVLAFVVVTTLIKNLGRLRTVLPHDHGSQTRGDVIDALEEMGFYRFATDVGRCKERAVASGFLFGDGVGRDVMADAEDLAEGGVGEWLDDIAGLLTGEGVTVGVVDQRFNDGGYVVVLDGAAHTMYTAAEAGDSWRLTAQRGLGMVNGLLARAGSPERFYSLYGGNDHRAVLLTAPMADLIASCGLFDPSEVPMAVP